MPFCRENVRLHFHPICCVWCFSLLQLQV